MSDDGGAPTQLKKRFSLNLSAADECLLSNESVAKTCLTRMHSNASEDDVYELPEFKNCVFVGHKATDLDSIASAIACKFCSFAFGFLFVKACFHGKQAKEYKVFFFSFFFSLFL